MIKLFVSDMDGTLLNDEHIISKRTAIAIKQLQQQGVEFLIATGRDYTSAADLLAPHNIECSMINLNGAISYNEKGEPQSLQSLATDQVQRVIQFCLENDLHFTLSTVNDFFVSDKQQFEERSRQFYQSTLHDPLTLAQIEAKLNATQSIFQWDPEHHPPLKMMILSPNHERLEHFKQVFEQDPNLDITSSGPDNLELTHITAQKGIAVERYATMRGLSLDEVITIGDSLNDRSMIHNFPNSYAMSNANPTIKQLAKHIAPANNEDGVAQVIEQLLSSHHN